MPLDINAHMIKHVGISSIPVHPISPDMPMDDPLDSEPSPLDDHIPRHQTMDVDEEKSTVRELPLPNLKVDLWRRTPEPVYFYTGEVGGEDSQVPHGKGKLLILDPVSESEKIWVFDGEWKHGCPTEGKTRFPWTPRTGDDPEDTKPFDSRCTWIGKLKLSPLTPEECSFKWFVPDGIGTLIRNYYK